MAKKSLKQLAADKGMSTYEYLQWRYVRRSPKLNGSSPKRSTRMNEGDDTRYRYHARPGETEEQRFARVAGRNLMTNQEERYRLMNTMDL